MKKYFVLILSIILVTTLCGCEEEDSPLLFTTIENTSPQNVKIDYYSLIPLAYLVVILLPQIVLLEN